MRLIDADKLDWWYKGRPIRRVLDEAPTIDAVPVVRCGECKYYGDEAFCPLRSLADHTDPINDFCSYGERKDG